MPIIRIVMQVDDQFFYQYFRPAKKAKNVKAEAFKAEKEEVVLVSMNKLLQLLSVCCFCSSPATVTEENGQKRKGALFTAQMVLV